MINERFLVGIRIRPVDEPELDKRLVCTRSDFDYELLGYTQQFDELIKWMTEHRELYGTQLGGL
jgi:hypothetical protein